LQVRSRDKTVQRILIVHYRIGGTDGVSLEVEKRRKALEQMGCEVRLLSGPLQNGADFVIPELEYDRDPIAALRKNTVEERNDFASEKELEHTIHAHAESIGRQLEEIFAGRSFDAVYVHNMLSMAVNLPASIALVRCLRSRAIPCVCVHHDFYWEGDFTTRPRYTFVQELIDEYLMPRGVQFRHVVINSINRRTMEDRLGIRPEVNYDVFDFEAASFERDAYNEDFRRALGLDESDIMILHATRIVPNKAIEFAFRFVRELTARRDLLNGGNLYDGRSFTPANRIALVLSGQSEQARTWYRDELEHLAEREGVDVIFAGDVVRPVREVSEGRKRYSFWDSYVDADMVTYTSVWEGWGNQFIEAVCAKKPAAVFEYPVFKSDIIPEGYRYLSLGDSFDETAADRFHALPEERVREAVNQACEVLKNGEIYESMVEHNYRIGRSHHGFDTLRGYLQADLAWLSGEE
jgi:glycosyltransferase involved in cell wall biosynthesis